MDWVEGEEYKDVLAEKYKDVSGYKDVLNTPEEDIFILTGSEFSVLGKQDLLAEKYQVDEETLANDRERTRWCLFGLARELLTEFGREGTPEVFRPVVDRWGYLSSGYRKLSASDRDWGWFCDYLSKIRTTPGSAWADAMISIEDAALSEGFPDSITSDDRANRLARLFRALARFHRGKDYRLSYPKIQEAIGVSTPRGAGLVAFRVERAELVVKVDRGVSYRSAGGGVPPRATTWRWLGPP